MQRFALLSILILLCLPAAARAGEHTLLNGSVRFTTPGAWQVLAQQTDSDTQHMTFYVPLPPGGNQDAHDIQDAQDATALAAISAWPNPNNMDATAYGDLVLSDFREAPEFQVLADTSQGPWRQVLWTGKQGRTSYLVVERFAAQPDLLLWFRLSWPASAEQPQELLDQLNLVLNTLAIGNQDVWLGQGLTLDDLEPRDQ